MALFGHKIFVFFVMFQAIGEPPLFLGSSVFFAIKDAVRSARQDAGLNGPFRFDSPATPERIRLACEDNITSKVTFINVTDKIIASLFFRFPFLNLEHSNHGQFSYKF